MLAGLLLNLPFGGIRHRYILPNGMRVEATRTEVEALLASYFLKEAIQELPRGRTKRITVRDVSKALKNAPKPRSILFKPFEFIIDSATDDEDAMIAILLVAGG